MIIDGPSDATLIAAVRLGDTHAYGVLYQRHLIAAKRAASCLAASPSEREDLVAEAFTRVLQMLRTGRGPDEEFRPYLLVTMRHLAINAARRAPATSLFAEIPDIYLPTGNDPVTASLSGSDAANAFAELPERWRMVLWHTEVEGESPAAIAPLLGLTPNGVAALAYRAREGLRQAYLRLHLPAADRKDCRATTDRLAGWVRHSISLPQQRKVSAHLETCARCREVADGLKEVNGSLRALLAPMLLGAPFAAAYATTASTGLTTATVSWLSALKASITATTAGAAAAVAVTAVTVVAANPPAGTAPISGAIARQPAIQHQAAAPITVGPGNTTAHQPAPAEQPVADVQQDTAGQQQVQTGNTDKQAAKAEKKAEKAAAKEAKKAAKTNNGKKSNG
jgi:RNA polymerase sigma factor (sigma-70 family)